MTYRFFAITSLASDITDRSRAIRHQVKEENFIFHQSFRRRLLMMVALLFLAGHYCKNGIILAASPLHDCSNRYIETVLRETSVDKDTQATLHRRKLGRADKMITSGAVGGYGAPV
jgi:hypothetical protein